MPRFRDIEQLVRGASYQINVEWHYLADNLEKYINYGLNTNPDFQRAHVWDQEKQERYVEYVLKGGMSGKDIYFNCPNWQSMRLIRGQFVLVDGKQRLEAVGRFMRGEIKAFGYKINEYEDDPRGMYCCFIFHINELKTREDVLQWYLDLNTGGVIHTDDELDKVRELLQEERAKNLTKIGS